MLPLVIFYIGYFGAFYNYYPKELLIYFIKSLLLNFFNCLMLYKKPKLLLNILTRRNHSFIESMLGQLLKEKKITFFAIHIDYIMI